MCTPRPAPQGGRSRPNSPCGKASEPTEHASGCSVREGDRADGHADADKDIGDYHGMDAQATVLIATQSPYKLVTDKEV